MQLRLVFDMMPKTNRGDIVMKSDFDVSVFAGLRLSSSGNAAAVSF